MRWPALIFLALLLALQYPLWFGKGSWQDVRELQTRLEALQEANQQLEQRNADLAAEVKDLKSGYEAMEEKARFELNLVKPGEVFVHIPDEPVTAVGR
ncbi:MULTISPECIES: cell division protein FtsB [Uliginosibacterium]|uniref:Cell division protein FtsB n=1 Tax=Uliginosibacterium aquaticum TaxID=2731212 RepID=A0ABX2IHF2_9RHOO|nr:MULTISPECIES: cell division protein FtsB [Uliginosibacterium]MDO6384970.1 cell division protein FtsB [Uliginosibacterium sp. 31-12]NSL55318.1 cell division protein FtsB [Uliginosibacterium aquaticum]PLK48657.1 cell division protein FtsB [Uliginosibacterium sp. TH139]